MILFNPYLLFTVFCSIVWLVVVPLNIWWYSDKTYPGERTFQFYAYTGGTLLLWVLGSLLIGIVRNI